MFALRLSEFEIEVMEIIWELGEASTPSIHKLINSRRIVKYSTVKTIVDRLEKKHSITRSRVEGRTIFYRPIREQKSVRIPLLKNFINKVFKGKSRPLVAHIIQEEELTIEDIEYLELVLQKRKSKLG